MTDHFSGSKVTLLTGKDFDSSFKLKKKPGKSGLIVFHMSWCSFCIQLAPEYKKLATKSGIKLYSVNGEASGNDAVFSNFTIQGFPTIRFISKDGKISSKNYMGDRDITSMMKYIKSSGMSGGAKRKSKPVKKAQKGGCVGGKCKGACKGGACKKGHKGGNLKKSLKKAKKAIKKSLKKVKKMLGGKAKRKQAKKSLKNKKSLKKRTYKKKKVSKK